MSLILPGVGQIYNGYFLQGIFRLIITPGFRIGSGEMLGWVCHLIAAFLKETPCFFRFSAWFDPQ